ncbi:hypothetical protein [Sphingomonas sp. RB1R13]|uniref:hypothetical protein n=1 Tax=Sphingomonas sp. RB1R13 TaxID=3096159 RepID=UPI002FC945EC
MPNRFKFSAFLFALALSTACPLMAQDAALKVHSAEAVKGVQTVTVGAFNVGFIFESMDRGKQNGGMIGAFGGATDAKSILVGVTPVMMQAITDAAYADFKAQLGARGFRVAEAASLFASPDFGRVKQMVAPYEAGVRLDKRSTGKASYYKPNALPSQFMLPGDIVSSGMSGMGLTMATGTNQYGVSQFAKTSGQGVIDVTYLIDFSQLKRPGAFSFGGLQVNSGIAVVDDYSKLTMVAPTGKVATITINQPVVVEGDFAAKQDTTKGAGIQKAANIASGVMGGLGRLGGFGGFGGMKFGNSKTFTFTARPDYQAGATKAATLANTRLLDQLAALR